MLFYFQASTALTLIEAFGLEFAAGSILKFGNDILTFASPMLLKFIINFAESGDHMWKGIFYACVLLLSTSTQTIFLGRYFYVMYAVGVRIKSSLTSAIYRKSLRVSSTSKKDTTTGEVVNLMSVDVQRVVDL